MTSKPDMFIWVYEYNYRVYEDDNGNRTSSPNYRKSWRKHAVVDETSRSWVLDDGTKIPKNGKASFDRLGSYVDHVFTQEEVDGRVYRHDNAHKIADAVGRVSPEVLKKVADIIGYTEKGEV